MGIDPTFTILLINTANKLRKVSSNKSSVNSPESTIHQIAKKIYIHLLGRWQPYPGELLFESVASAVTVLPAPLQGVRPALKKPSG